MTDAAVIISAIERKGWQVRSLDSGWHMTHPDAGVTCTLSSTPSWLCFYAPQPVPAHSVPTGDVPTGDVPTNDLPADALHAALLRCEAEFMVKWALDPAGGLGAALELPGNADLHLVDTALSTLVRGTASGAATARSSAPTPDRSAKELYFSAAPGIPEESVAYTLRALEPWGWRVKGKPQGITWPLGYKGQRLFDVYLTISQAWTYFHVPLLSDAPALRSADPAVVRAFLAYLLRLNDVWYMAKVGLDDGGRVLLMLDVPTLALDFEMFRRVARLLGTYLDTTAREIQIMAQLEADPQLRALIIVEE